MDFKKNNILSVLYIGLLVFMLFWGYNQVFWTQSDPTLTLKNEQACYDAFAIYTFAKVIHQEHVHPQEVYETLWGPLPYYLYALGLDVFGEKLSSIREVVAFFSGIWGAIIFFILYFSTKKPTFSFFIALLFIPFSGHINFHANRGYAHFYTFIFQALCLLGMLHYVRKPRMWLLALIGIILGVSFEFKYELSLLALLAVLMSLYIFEGAEAYKNLKSGALAGKQDRRYLTFRISKIIPLILAFLYSGYLIRQGFLAQILYIFWMACGILLVFELVLMLLACKSPRKIEYRPSSFYLRIMTVVLPFLFIICAFFIHLWFATGTQIAKESLLQLFGTSNQITRMKLCSPAMSEENALYFAYAHPITVEQVALWCICAILIYAIFFFIKDISLRGLITASGIFAVFIALMIKNVALLSMYYFTAIISVALWAIFLYALWKSRMDFLLPEFMVFLSFIMFGTLSLLRESASLDLHVWSLFPPLIGCILLLMHRDAFAREFSWLKAGSLIAIFYFAILNWAQVETWNLLRCQDATNTYYKAVDSEFDLLIPVETASQLQMMKRYFYDNLGKDEYIFIFSGHFYPYLFTPNGIPMRRLNSFQNANYYDEERMRSLFKNKNIKFVLFSVGGTAYNSDRAIANFPKLYAYISQKYSKTDTQFLNFVVYKRKE